MQGKPWRDPSVTRMVYIQFAVVHENHSKDGKNPKHPAVKLKTTVTQSMKGKL